MTQCILTIDDQDEYLIVLHHHLTTAGYMVLQASSAEAGFRLAKQQQVDLIICDLLMPGFDGMAMLETVKADAKLKHLPFIFLTAMDYPRMQTQALAGGATRYLTKPLDDKLLLATVRELLQ